MAKYLCSVTPLEKVTLPTLPTWSSTDAQYFFGQLRITMPSAHLPQDRLPVYFIGHAGVNLLFSDSASIQTVRSNLKTIGDEIRALSPKPKAIVAFSGHFEAGEIHGPNVIEGKE